MKLQSFIHQSVSKLLTRSAIARAFLKDAPVLLLDEATSSVDVRTEGAIIEAMERLMQRRTTIVIAHRLGTLENCDVRFELKEGKLAVLHQRNQRAVRQEESTG